MYLHIIHEYITKLIKLHSHNLIKIKDLNIEFRPTTPKANKPQAAHLQ